MDESQQRVAAYYTAMWIAQRRQLLDGALGGPSEEWHELVWRMTIDFWVELIERQASGTRMLECGGATGRLPAALAARGWNCALVDLTTQGPALARTRFEQQGAQGTFITGDVMRLPFPDASFDVVSSHGLLDLMHDIRPPVQEMVRVLRPGGFFIASAFPRRLSLHTIAQYGIELLRRLGSWHSRGSTLNRQPGHRISDLHRNSFSINHYVETCREAGLPDVVGTTIWPFPYVNLPDRLMRFYLRIARKLEPQWRSFDRSLKPWARVGVMVALWGHRANAATVASERRK